MSNMILFILLGVIVILNILNLLKKTTKSDGVIETKLEQYEKRFNGFETLLKDEFDRNRTNYMQMTKDSRTEAAQSFDAFTKLMELKINNLQLQITNSAKENREELAKNLKSFEKSFNDNVKSFNDLQKQKFDELGKTLKSFEKSFNDNVRSFNDLQKQKFDELSLRFNDLTVKTEQKLEKMRESLESKLKLIQDDNNIKLEKIRETVDEKLHKTLETRLGESFKLVSERLELVQKGLGEMQTLATGVGDLKKVLSNVKTKGVLGEIQLNGLLEQLLTPDQFERNVKTNSNSNAFVEYAVKIPAKDDIGSNIWLPIDAKFPSEDYELLTIAYELGDKELVEKSIKELSRKIKLFAKDIHDKYIDPPRTTDFGIMFLPFEGLYAEVLRIPGLFESIQREYKVTITGPTTISALLNSLQMGFRTLAIEKRSSEVWTLLGTVKTEFGKFGDVLDATKNKLTQAVNEIDKAGTRTRAIERQLRDVQELPSNNNDILP